MASSAGMEEVKLDSETDTDKKVKGVRLVCAKLRWFRLLLTKYKLLSWFGSSVHIYV